jgi:hypothetical protein
VVAIAAAAVAIVAAVAVSGAIAVAVAAIAAAAARTRAAATQPPLAAMTAAWVTAARCKQLRCLAALVNAAAATQSYVRIIKASG